MNTVQRLIGTCQICEGEFKLDQSALMVHHGYKRPGHGYIVGDCQAVGHPAYEQSCECLKSYTASLRAALAVAQERLRQLAAGEVKELTVTSRSSYAPKTVTYKVGDRDFPHVLRSKIGEQESLIRWLERDIQRCDKRVRDWRPLPIRTLEEVEAKQRASRDEARAVREARRQAKLKEKIESYQKRIDTAVRRRTCSTIANVFESAPSKLRDMISPRQITLDQALRLLERDHVWRAFGLIDTEGTNVSATLGKMLYPQLHEPYPWPEGLK